jgi:hypothetical protein
MLVCAILTWGKDLMIMPCDSYEWLKGKRNRLDLPDVDYIIFDSGFFMPINFDNNIRQLDEEEMIELFGNPAHQHPAWDREDERKVRTLRGNKCLVR